MLAGADDVESDGGGILYRLLSTDRKTVLSSLLYRHLSISNTRPHSQVTVTSSSQGKHPSGAVTPRYHRQRLTRTSLHNRCYGILISILYVPFKL